MIDHMVGHKTSLKIFLKIEIMGWEYSSVVEYLHSMSEVMVQFAALEKKDKKI
jgi:hypothetical protein